MLLLLACTGADSKPDNTGNRCDTCITDTGADSTAADSGDSATGADSGADTDPPDTDCDLTVPPPQAQDTGAGPLPLRALSGEITWQADFDAAAEAAGLVDCSYRRVYTGTERLDQGYLCPDCSLIVPAESDMVEGYDDCYRQIDDADPIRTEMVGLGEVDGALHFFRTGVQNVTPGDLGPVSGDAGSFAISYSSTSAASTGQVTLTLSGSFTAAESADTAPDPAAARTEPYACGWPTNSPGGATGWTVAAGQEFPDVWLEDQCGERVSLRDFRGYYLVVDVAAVNCGPCQAMAASAEAFLGLMEEECIPVQTVTLLAESLSSVNMPADLATRLEWVDSFGITSPVVGDEGFGYALIPGYVGEDNFGYPTTVVLDPEGRLIGTTNGYGEEVDDQGHLSGGTWIDIRDMIRQDAGQ